MDINTLRIAVTVLSFFTFLGIIWWALAKKHQARFERAAYAVLEDETPAASWATEQNLKGTHHG
ncbi:cbb3-type cytochrome oxidase subunit 3 [Parvibium lacunae]|uniref:CcoQ/FixQ family Cbb3-type cytochrome c oxidase assembly chaperone n=1 Tax=Parvibium lacunae TaxID=1888893 RepID=A0A368L3A7_9BURK|nr:CcoQ/FixQ family Cbb3-type cytochrome c oxidase assembly chaperone [Parvibium lacunae]